MIIDPFAGEMGRAGVDAAASLMAALPGLPMARRRHAAVGEPSGWSPAELSPRAWYDAVLSPKQFGSGSLVSRWDDLSGNERHAAQNTAAFQPAYDAADGWLEFDGTNDALVPSSSLIAAGTGSFTLAAVYRKDNTADRYVYSQGGSSNHRSIFLGGASGWRFSLWGALMSDQGSLSVGADHIAIWTYTGSARQIHVDGAQIFSGSYSAANLLASSPVIGGPFDNGANRIAGRMRSLISFGAGLSQQDRERLEGYLAHRWSIAGNLPAGHPHKAAAP